MKRNGFFAGALALAMTAGSLFMPMSVSNVKAAEVTNKAYIDFEITGNYTKKKMSQADAKVINKTFKYDSALNHVSICSADAKGFIDWDNSAVESWKVYRTEVFQPVLSRNIDGNLVVATDKNGDVQKAWHTFATYGTEKAGVISHQKDLFHTDFMNLGDTYDKTNEELNQGKIRGFFDDRMVTDDAVPALNEFYDYVLSENHFCLSAECDKHIQTINSHLGLTKLTTWRTTGRTTAVEKQDDKYYVSEQTQITDAYVIRVYYTRDEIPMNWMHRNSIYNIAAYGYPFEVVDVYGNSYGEIGAPFEFANLSIGTEDRLGGYTDFWILPEGVDTVLTLEDTSTPGNSTNTPNEKISIKKADVKLSKTSYSYDGKAKKPSVRVTLKGKTLVKDKDYTVSYTNNKNIGTATVTIKGKGNYTGTVSQNFKIQLKKGKTFTSGKYKYKVTGASAVTFNGINSSKTTKVTIPKTVKYGGKTFQITSIADEALKNQKKVTSVTIGENVTKIGASAFYGCKNLKTITIQSENLKTVGKDALKNIKSTAKIKVPESKLSAYQKLLKGKGQGSKVKIVGY